MYINAQTISVGIIFIVVLLLSVVEESEKVAHSYCANRHCEVTVSLLLSCLL